MSTAQYPANAPVAPWFSDASADRKRSMVTLAILASLVLHLVIIALIALALGLLPKEFMRSAAKPQVEEIELIVIPPQPKEELAPALALQADPQRAFLDSRGLAEANEAAKDALIESDKNMKAASEMPATGSAPLPSQDGLNRPEPNFATQENTFGKNVAVEMQQAKPEPMAAVPTEPLPPTLYKPQPIAKANIDPVKQTPVITKTLPEMATATPPVLPEIAETMALAQRALEKIRQVTQPTEDEIPLTTAKPMVSPPKEMTEAKPVPVALPERPRPLPIPQPTPAATPLPLQFAKAATPAPQVPRTGYQPQLQKTRIEGNISNRGKAAVDAVSTPLARYKKQVNDAIGSRWYYYIRGKMDLIAAGSVNMSFSINEKGQAVSVRIDSNTSNQSLADVCERAIREAEIEPPPPDLIAPMKDGRLDYSLTFTFYNL